MIATSDALHARHSWPGTPSAVARARDWTRLTLSEWGVHATDAALLVVSELATNACCHTLSSVPGGQFTVRLSLYNDHIRVTVKDAGPRTGRTPTRRTPRFDSVHGRGLALVDSLSLRWGPLKVGTGVFAELPR